MEKTPIQQVNGEMWIFAALLIGIVIIQAVLFLRLALKWNKRRITSLTRRSTPC